MHPQTLLSFLLLTMPLGAQLAALPALPPAANGIRIPDNSAKMKYHFLAVGKQIYQCENGAWTKTPTPEATLYDTASNLTVHHAAGPSWTTADGKSTVKADGAKAAHYAAPDGVSIDWLKLDADKYSRTGAFSDVGTIQRLYTGAGKAPAAGCTEGQTYQSPYTAHYYFWTAK